MKNIILTTICSFLFLFSFAQENLDSILQVDEIDARMQTFNNTNKGTHGIYIGIGGGYANIGDLDFSTIN